MKKFVLKFIWLEKVIAVSLDQKIGYKSIPLTEYFFWPQKDAWEEMKNYLDSKSWISYDESVLMLNQITEVINYWQEKYSVETIEISKLREMFPSCIFIGKRSF